VDGVNNSLPSKAFKYPHIFLASMEEENKGPVEEIRDQLNTIHFAEDIASKEKLIAETLYRIPEEVRDRVLKEVYFILVDNSREAAQRHLNISEVREKVKDIDNDREHAEKHIPLITLNFSEMERRGRSRQKQMCLIAHEIAHFVRGHEHPKKQKERPDTAAIEAQADDLIARWGFERVYKREDISTKKKHPKWGKTIFNLFVIIGLVLTILSIWATFYFSSPINFEIWDNVSEDQERLVIYGRNNDLFRSPGVINLYRLEVSDSKPHIQLQNNRSFKRGIEKMLFNLSINIGEEEIPTQTPECKQCVTIPYPNLYFLTEKTSISYKITCDKCTPQGVVRRIPEFQMTPFSLSLDWIYKEFGDIIVPTYSWVEVELEDLIDKND